MAHSGGVITEQVDISDIQAVLGVASTDLSVLSTHENINIYAKNKPVRLATFDSITASQRRILKWGLSAVEFNGAAHPAMLYNKVIENSGNGIIYNRPTGGNTAPYRIGDFSLYNHYAYFPIESTKSYIGAVVKPQYSDSTKVIYLTVNWQEQVKGAEIDIKELYIGYAPNPVNNQCFLGVMVLETSGSIIGWTTGLNSGTEAQMTKVTLPNAWQNRDVLLFFFLADYNLEGVWHAGSNESNAKEITFWALPNDLQHPNPVRVRMEKYAVPSPGWNLEWYASVSGTNKPTCTFRAILTSTTSTCIIATQKVRFNFYRDKSIFDFIEIPVRGLSVAVGGSDSVEVSDKIELSLIEEGITEVRAIYNNQTKVIWEQ